MGVPILYIARAGEEDEPYQELRPWESVNEQRQRQAIEAVEQFTRLGQASKHP